MLIAYASMYGNTEAAAQALASRLVEQGVRTVEVRDVSTTHVSHLMELTMRLSHVVLAGVTYNGGVFPPMGAFLEDMKALGVRDRTFAILENGTWAPASGKLMAANLEALPGCTVLEPRISLRSALNEDSQAQLTQLAQAIAGSLN